MSLAQSIRVLREVGWAKGRWNSKPVKERAKLTKSLVFNQQNFYLKKLQSSCTSETCRYSWRSKTKTSHGTSKNLKLISDGTKKNYQTITKMNTWYHKNVAELEDTWDAHLIWTETGQKTIILSLAHLREVCSGTIWAVLNARRLAKNVIVITRTLEIEVVKRAQM